MPIHCSIPTNRISQAEFGDLAHEVMRHVFDIHNEFGRFFDEAIYKKELAERTSGVAMEVAVTVSHGSFAKPYFADVLVNASGLFEFKAADAILPRHRGQTLNYLLLLDLAHAKVVNIRPEKVGHEFVNCPRRLSELRDPRWVDDKWDSRAPGAPRFRDTLLALITDWGSGLESSLYEEAITHFLGGEDAVLQPVPVIGSKGHLTEQRMKLAENGVAFKITGLLQGLEGV